MAQFKRGTELSRDEIKAVILSCEKTIQIRDVPAKFLWIARERMAHYKAILDSWDDAEQNH